MDVRYGCTNCHSNGVFEHGMWCLGSNELMAIESRAIANGKLYHVGSLANNKLLLFLGRSSHQKNSAQLQSLMDAFQHQGYTLVWFESQRVATETWLTQSYEDAMRYSGGLSAATLIRLKKLFKKPIKAGLLLPHPSRWFYYWQVFQEPNIKQQVQELRTVLAALGPEKNIHVLAHSAGARMASVVADTPSIQKIIGFGYPFKHPDKPQEKERTQHLAYVKKPFLIFQGLDDEYGGQEVPHKYPLSPTIELSFLHTNHDYENITPSEWVQVCAKINAFLSH